MVWRVAVCAKLRALLLSEVPHASLALVAETWAKSGLLQGQGQVGNTAHSRPVVIEQNESCVIRHRLHSQDVAVPRLSKLCAAACLGETLWPPHHDGGGSGLLLQVDPVVDEAA